MRNSLVYLRAGVGVGAFWFGVFVGVVGGVVGVAADLPAAAERQAVR